jgi:integrase
MSQTPDLPIVGVGAAPAPAKARRRKKGRRAHDEGSVRLRRDGRWEVRIELERGPNGERRRKSVFAATEADAIEALKKLHAREQSGHVLQSSTPTVKEFLEDWYARYTGEWAPATSRSYRQHIDQYLVPTFGTLRLEALKARDIQHWIDKHTRESGARRRIEMARNTLRSALSEAERLQLVPVNVAMKLRLPKRQKKGIVPFTMEQARAFLDVAKDHRLYALFAVALACGLRLAEAMGLKWADIDLDTGRVRIRQQLQRTGKKKLELRGLKTEKSRRTLTLPQVCIEALRKHRQRQNQERLQCGDRWTDTGLVFTTYRQTKVGKGKEMRVGAGMHPRNVTRIWYDLLKAANISKRGIHALRHSAASLLLAEGVTLSQVSQLLGHSEQRLTADLYGHLLEETAATAAGHMDRLLASK